MRAFYSQRLFQTPTETAGAQAPLSPLGQTDGLANFPALFQIARLLQTENETSLCLLLLRLYEMGAYILSYHFFHSAFIF